MTKIRHYDHGTEMTYQISPKLPKDSPQDVEFSECIEEEAYDDEEQQCPDDSHAADGGQVAEEQTLLHPQTTVEDDGRQEIATGHRSR